MTLCEIREIVNEQSLTPAIVGRRPGNVEQEAVPERRVEHSPVKDGVDKFDHV